MIRIVRGPVPAFLSGDKVMAAKAKLHRSYDNAERQERFRFEVSLLGQVKSDLLQMCNDKCAYCESRIGIVDLGDVDNFRPKAGAKGFNTNEYAPMHYWWLAYEWDNLLIACQICNQKYKRDYFPLELESQRARIGATGKELLEENALLIDPCMDDPANHLEFNQDGRVVELSKKGKVTIEILGLNRTELVKRRNEIILQLRHRLEILRFTEDLSNSFTKEFVAFKKDLFSDHPTQEYAAFQRTIFNAWRDEYAALWNKIKEIHRDLSGVHSYSKKIVEDSEQLEISNVGKHLSTIKRFSIRSVEIINFKSIENIKLNMISGKDADRESWLLVLGDNGIGKSSILQAIALALAGKKQLEKLDLDAKDFLRRGSTNGKVVICSFEHDKPVELLFDENGFTTDLEEAVTFLLAYGSTRLLPKGNIVPDHDKEPYINIRNLFDYSIALEDPNEWLSKIDTIEFNERVAPAFFDVLALRGDDKLWLNDGKIRIRQFGEDHDLEDNSDGYKMIVALMSDMMQSLSVDRANYHNAQGIVLIDEIGNHLHPRWRIKIAGALRKAFPRLQFIVTTHEPLCLRGLAHGEVAVLVRDQKNAVRALDQALLPDHSMMRIEQLLTSDLFGLINVMDEETEKTYEEYYRLLSKKEEEKTPEDKSKIEELSANLGEKEVLGNTPQEQIFYKVINDTIAKQIRQEGFKTREELKKETIKEVKDLLATKKMNWL